MKQDIVNSIFQTFSNNNPHPKTELEYRNNYTLAVAVILSAQATDVSVNKATKELFTIVDTPEAMVELGEEGLKEHIKTIGLFNSKAKNVLEFSRQLIERHNSELPEDFDKLVALAGVGRKTANVILHCAFGHNTIAVDTHVFRVSKRLGLAKGSTPEKVEKELMQNVPQQWLSGAHHWLILHGRYTCKARKPLCDMCGVTKYCEYFAKNQ